MLPQPTKPAAPSFDDLDDASLDEPASKPETFLEFSAQLAATRGKQLYKCERCGGRGVVYFRNGASGKCYRCDGSGQQKRKPERELTPQEAQRRGAGRAKRAAKKAQALAAQAAWRAAHADVIEWIRARDGRNDFATSLSNSLGQYGTLTENQVGAVRRALANAAAREAERAAAYLDRRERAAYASVYGETVKPAARGPVLPASGLDLSPLPAGRYAVPAGDTRLKLLVKKPTPPSKWAGWIFVGDAAVYGMRQKYGSQRPGGLYQGHAQESLRAILADPKAASAAYGKLTNTCGVCGRKLEDEESVARGIGPICFARFA